MARKDIFTILSENYNVPAALKVISELFESKLVSNRRSSDESIENFIDNHNLFDGWKYRQSCINTVHMRRQLRIDNLKNSNEFENLIICLEYYANMFNLFAKNYDSCSGYEAELSKYYGILKENIMILLDHINHNILEENDGKFLIVPMNPSGTAAAEISTKKTGINILKYHHGSLKGNVDEKRKLLVAIAHEYESVLDNPPDGHTNLFKKTNGLLNCLHLRHNNEVGKHAKDLPKNLEKWYDEVYQMLLLCILENDNVKRMADVQSLLDTIKK